MSNVVLKIENLSKQYRLGLVGTGTLSHDLNRWWHLTRGKEDPYLTIGETNDRASKGKSEYVWALKDINLEVIQGEVLGIIGKNGAGKSTLLKILSKVTGPTTGTIKAKGRIASLLEVGTGFHPELTGRENIFLNGALLGMTKKEISNKLDSIIDFAGVERYVDTPVKRYSSGMRVRLGFAVAAFLEPEILVIDEVLAVGDEEFQKKAIGKMQDVSRGEGRTVLFVSHNMSSIAKLCTRCIELQNGTICYEGNTQEVIQNYLQSSSSSYQVSIADNTDFSQNNSSKLIRINSIEVIGENHMVLKEVKVTDKIGIKIDYSIKEKSMYQFYPSVHFYSYLGEKIFGSIPPKDFVKNLKVGEHSMVCWIPSNFLNSDTYSLTISIVSWYPENKIHVSLESVLNIVIGENQYSPTLKPNKKKFKTVIRPLLKWGKF